jgi:hypothetical protein
MAYPSIVIAPDRRSKMDKKDNRKKNNPDNGMLVTDSSAGSLVPTTSTTVYVQ